MIFNCCKYEILKCYLISIACLLFLNQHSAAQTNTIDSLKKLLPSLHNTGRIDCLNKLGSEFSDRYWSISKYQQTDTAYMYTQQAIYESKKLQYEKGIGMAYLNMAFIEEEHGNFKKAEDYTRRSLPILTKQNIQPAINRAYVFLGYILFNRGFFAQSINLYQQGLPYYEAIKDTDHITAIYRVIARAYDAMGNSGDAFTYFQKDFAIQKTPTDSWGKRSTATLKAAVYLAAGDTVAAAFYYKLAAALSINQHVIVEAYHLNMATAYNLQRKYDSALLEVRNSINKIQSSKSDSLFRKPALMISYMVLSGEFLALKQFDSAIIYSLKPLSFFRNGDFVIQLMPMLKTVAAAYYEKHQDDSALQYTNRLLQYAQRSGARPFTREAYKLLWQIYTNQHNNKLADNYHLKYILLNDSLQNDKYISQSAAWKAINDININEASYKNKLKINEERNKAKIEYIAKEKKTQSYLFITAIVLISLFTILILRNNRLKRKQDQLQLMMTEANIQLEKQKREQEVSQLNQQKTELELQALRAQMNPHFIFNCLNSINRFIIKNDATKAADYLTKFAKLIRIVLEQSGKSFISLEDELKCLKLYMDLEVLRFEMPFSYDIQLNDIHASSVMIPTMLLQPFIENAIWHGLQSNKQNGRIRINMQLQHNILHCKIYDNGVGRSATSINQKVIQEKTSLGINITQHRLQLIDSSAYKESAIEMTDLKNEDGNNEGTCVYIKIPIVN